MAPGNAKRKSSRRQPIEAPMTDYERKRLQNIIEKNRMFQRLGIGQLRELTSAIARLPTPTREDSGSLYEPADVEIEDAAIEQGAVRKEGMQLSNNMEVSNSVAVTASANTGGSSKRVMVLPEEEHPRTREEDQPVRRTRQWTRAMSAGNEVGVVRTAETQDGSAEDMLNASNVETTEDQSAKRRHVGRGLDKLSRGLNTKIAVHIPDGKLRPEVPLQAAKLASEAGIILRDHVPILPHWKDYKNDKALVNDYIGKVASHFTIDTTAKPVKDACSDLLKRGQRQMRYRLKKEYFDNVPANEVRTTSPLPHMSDMAWKNLVQHWSDPKHKEKCLKNKNSRGLVRYPQKTGSRCYVAQAYVAKQTKYKDSPSTAIDLFKDTHCSSTSGFAENVQKAIAQMESIISQPLQEGQVPKTPTQVVAQVLPKHSTFLKNVGIETSKKTAPTTAADDHVMELESQLQAEREASAALRSEMAELQRKVQEKDEAAKKDEEAARLLDLLLRGKYAPSDE